jgi:uncharacterized protein DUF6916
MMMDPSQYLVETFTPHVGSEFKAAVDGGKSLALALVEVQPGPSSPQVLQFSLVFRGPLEPVLPQRVVQLQHPRLGELDLFLVPIAKEAQGIMYQAVFNRFREPGPAARP